MLARVRRADLTAQARLTLRNDRISEPGDVDAAVEELCRHRDSLGGVADDDRHDRMDALANANILRC